MACEVPAAMTLDEIWDIVNTAERTRKHAMMLENCVYDYFELTTLNMAQQGLFGEVLHAEVPIFTTCRTSGSTTRATGACSTTRSSR